MTEAVPVALTGIGGPGAPHHFEFVRRETLGFIASVLLCLFLFMFASFPLKLDTILDMFHASATHCHYWHLRENPTKAWEQLKLQARTGICKRAWSILMMLSCGFSASTHVILCLLDISSREVLLFFFMSEV